MLLHGGAHACREIAASLIAAGRPASEPAAVVEAGTLPGQRTVRGTLATIAEAAADERIRAPAITVVGAVAALAERARLAARRGRSRGAPWRSPARARRPASWRGACGELGARVIAGAGDPHPPAAAARRSTLAATTSSA